MIRALFGETFASFASGGVIAETQNRPNGRSKLVPVKKVVDKKFIRDSCHRNLCQVHKRRRFATQD